jgi:hypothetical protein
MPLWLSVPLLVGGVGALWQAAEIAPYLLPVTVASVRPTLCFLGVLGLGLFLLSFSFARNRIFYDLDHGQVVVRHSGLFGSSERRVALGSSTGVEVQKARGAPGGVP